MTKVGGFQPLTFVIKISILDLAVVLDTPLPSVRGSFQKICSDPTLSIWKTFILHPGYHLSMSCMFNLGDM